MASELRYSGSKVTLPSPDLGNSLTVKLLVKTHRALDGTYWSYKNTPFPKTLDVSWAYLNRNKVREIEEFLSLSRGHQLVYVDHADREYLVKSKTTEQTFAHAARRNNQFSLELEIDG